MPSHRLLALAGIAALVAGGACAFHTSGAQPGQGGGGSATSSSSSGSGGVTSSSSSASSATSSSTSSSSTSASSTSASSSSGMPAHCSNGKKDMGETGVDCGGGECSPCMTGSMCMTGADCSNGLCFQGFCCASDCSTACNTCSGMDSNAGAGMCGLVAATKPDPDGRCAKGPCDGTGKCRCANGMQDGDETGVDCGGACGKCLGVNCANDGECASGHCSDGVCCNVDCNAMGNCYACNLTTMTTSGMISWKGACTPVFNGTQGKCAPGSACDPNHACVSGKSVDNIPCTQNSDCASNLCATGFDHQCHPYGPAGDPCVSHWQCISDQCDGSTNLCK